MATDRRSGSTCGCWRSRRCGYRGGLLAAVWVPVMMMPIVTCGCSWRRAQQVIQNVNNGADVTFRPAVSVLKGRIQSAAECAGVHTFAMMMHTLYYGPLSASRILLNLKKARQDLVHSSVYYACGETHSLSWSFFFFRFVKYKEKGGQQSYTRYDIRNAQINIYIY